MSIPSKSTTSILADPNALSSILVGGVQPAVDLNPHSPTDPRSDSDSFYILNYLKANGHKFTVLFHLIVLNKPIPPGPASLLAISLLDETYDPPELYFSVEVPDVGLKQTIVLPNKLDIQVFNDPNHTSSLGHLSGTMNNLTVQGSANDGKGNHLEIALTLDAIGPTMPDLASGVIPFPGGMNYEFAFPKMSASGTLKLNGATYSVTGYSWLDREWGRYGALIWTWMGIELDNGVQISLWDQQAYQPNPQSYVGGRAFATILEANGNITVSTVTIKEGSLVASSNGQQYPNNWTVTIPGKSKLDVQTLKQNQDIASMIPRLEAKSRATGTYDNKAVAGDAFVEVGFIPPPPPAQAATTTPGQAANAAGQVTPPPHPQGVTATHSPAVTAPAQTVTAGHSPVANESGHAGATGAGQSVSTSGQPAGASGAMRTSPGKDPHSRT